MFFFPLKKKTNIITEELAPESSIILGKFKLTLPSLSFIYTHSTGV